MRLVLVGVGHLRHGPERDLVVHYIGRAAAAGRGIGFPAIESRTLEESRARRAADRKLEEAKAIRATLAAGAATIVFDETGRNLSSAEFAAELLRLRDMGVPTLALVLGGPDGLDATLRAEARHVLAFGAMTWPHQLARVLAAEQIYRAITILARHPYHRN